MTNGDRPDGGRLKESAVNKADSSLEVARINVVVDGTDILLCTGWQDGYLYEHTTSEKVVELATDALGEGNGIRVGIGRGAQADEAVENALFESLIDAGLSERSIAWHGASDAYSYLDEIIRPKSKQPTSKY